MAAGYKWRKMQTENTLAQFVTLWIANTAGKSFKQRLTLDKLFRDGRFTSRATQEEIDEIRRDLDL